MASNESNGSSGRSGRTRREFLEVAAIGTAGLIVGCGDDEALGPDAAPVADAAPAVDAAPVIDGALPDAAPITPPDYTAESAQFPLAVASGDVLETRAILWTRYDGAMPLALVVWEMDGDDYRRIVWESEPTAAEGGFVHVDIDGIAGGQHYRYAFFEMDGIWQAARSPIGRFRAALPADATERVVLGAVSCADNGRDFLTLEHAATRTDLDSFLIAGDIVYADSADDVAEYRAKWQENLLTDGYRALLSSTSVVAMWDDHEVDNNWNAETVDPAKLAAARQTLFEHMPLRRDETYPNRLWKKLRWGRTLEIFVLDCRGERLPSTRSGPDAQYISPEQLEWLEQGLLNSDAVFKVIVNTVPITNFPALFDLASNDRWEGYPAQREALLSFIDTNEIGGVLWVSGDFHMPSVGWVDTGDELGAGQLEVLVGPAAQTPNPLGLGLTAPQFVWAAAQNSYTVFDFDPTTGEVAIEVFSEDGDTLFAQTFTL